jgi:hypothetical protein
MSPRKFEHVKKTVLTDGHHKGEVEETHPAFVQVTLHRTSGSFKLYGSALTKNDGAIRLDVVSSTSVHTLGRDWRHGGGRQLISVYLSPAQFAELITSMNVGGGVPGTLSVFDGKYVPEIPFEHETEATRVVDSFKADVAKNVKEMNKLVADVDALLAQPKTTKAEREELRSKLGILNHLYQSNAPFMVESFQEAAEKVVTSAKAEVEAFTSHAIQSAGLQAIAEGRMPVMLNGKEEAK